MFMKAGGILCSGFPHFDVAPERPIRRVFSHWSDALSASHGLSLYMKSMWRRANPDEETTD